MKRDIQLRKLTLKDKDAMIALQMRVHQEMPVRSLLVRTTDEEFKDSLQNDLCLGAFDGQKLVGASIMVINRNTERNLGLKMGFDPYKCVTLDTAFVDKDYVGNGLQRQFIRERLRAAEELGAEAAFATVAKNNAYSMENMRSMGFSIHKTATLYGGYPRVVLIKRLRR